MNPILLSIIIVLFAIAFIYLVLKYYFVNKFNRILRKNDSEQLLRMTQSKVTKFFISDFVCDLYLARSYFNTKDEEHLVALLRTMMGKQYDAKDEEQYLTLYYHYYVHKKDTDFALELLKKIEQTENAKLIKYCVWTKDVLFDDANTMCADIEAAIDNKDYYGFPLATCCYLIGVQKMRLGSKQDAIEWLETALDVFLNHDIYVADVKEAIEELHQQGYSSQTK